MTDIIQTGIEIDVTGVDRAEVALKRLVKAGEDVDKAFKGGADSAKKTGESAGKAGDEAEKAADKFGDFTDETKKMAAATNSLTSAARKMGAALVSAFALNKTISAITAFEDSILRLQATSGATADAMAEMERQSRLLGATSRFSARQTADAQNFLAMAGLKTNEILSATPSIMKFASAASIDLARSADIATNALGGMQLPVEQLDRVMNTMVVTAQSANTNIDQLGSAFAYAAPLAVTAAIDVETLAAAIGVLGDAGIQGSRAGTGMVGVIRQLSNATPDAQKALATYGLTMADVDIKSRGLVNVLDTLQKANLNTADAMMIFGSESAAAALILSSSSEKVRELAEANENAGDQLGKVSSLLDSSVSAAFAGVTSAIEEMMLQTGDAGLTGTLKTLAITTAGVINSFNGMLPEFAEANGLSKEFARNIELASTALKGIGATVGVWALVRGAIFGATQAQLAFNLAARANPYVLIAASIAGAAVMLYQFTTAQDKAAVETKRLWDRAVDSAAAYQVAMGNLTNTQNILNTLHHKELKLQEEMQAMRDMGFKQYSWRANQYRKKEEELLAVQQRRKELLDAKIAADKAEGLRQIEANKHQEEANALQKRAAELQAELERQMKAGTAASGEAEEALKALAAERQRALETQIKSAEAITKGNEELRTEIEQTGKVGAELVELERRRNGAAMAALKEKAASLELTKGREKEVAAIRDQIKELAERNRLIGISYTVKAIDDIRKRNDALREEIREIGKSRRELVALEQQRNMQAVAALNEKAATLELIAGREEEVAVIREQIDALNERNRLLGEKIDTEEVYESQKKIADQWQSLSDDMGRTFTDAIIQGGASAKEAIKRMFTNMVLRPIIEPIAQGVAGMFVNVLGGGQSGGLMGMLGGGSGGGGFSLGSVASMGSKIYSAFTGWGKAAVAGWNQSGVTGIFTGIWDYGAGLMSGFSGGLSAFSVGVEGAYLAPGLAGPTTAGATGMMGLGNTVGNLSKSAPWMSALVGALKGYENSGLKGAAAGAAGGVGGAKLGATAGSYFGPVGTAVGAIVGGVLGASAGASLFGGKWKTEDVGIGLGFDAGDFVGQEYEYRTKKGGLFSSDKKETLWHVLDEEVYDALSEATAESVSGVKGLFEALGFEIAEDALSGLETGITRISTQGKTDEQILEEIDDWLSKTGDAMVGELHEVLGTGLDLDLEGLTNFALNLVGVNEILGVLGLTAYESSIAGAELAQTLSGLAGGLENLASASDVYYQNFFTAEEQFEHAFAAMGTALNDAGLSAIGSREAYREVVEGLDLTTEAGQEMFATMMAMSGIASDYFGILEGYQNQLAGMSEALNAEPILGYTAVLESLQKDFEQMAKELDIVGLATEESLDTLEQFRQKMAEMATLDLFGGGQSMADALRQGLLGTWDGEAIGDYLARSISDGVYGAIAGQFANQITDILLQGIVAPMINAAMTGASISEAVSRSTIDAMVAQAQAVAQVAAEVMDALEGSGVMDDLRRGLGGSFTMPSVSYIRPTYRPPVTPSYSGQKVDDSWERLLESIISQTERAQQRIADMGRTTYEKGLAAIASTVADYQAQIAQSTASNRQQLTAELAAMEQAERKLLEAQMNQKAADLLARLADELEKIGKTDAELALMNIEKQTQDYINSLQDVGRATAGNIAQVEAWSQAMKDAAAKDAQIKAASGAFDALGRAVDSQRSIITEALELARDVADAAGNAAKSLFEDVLGASAAGAEQARAFISDALSAARSTGYLPDSDKLRNAIDAATRGFDEAAVLSVADANWQKLVLANQLRELADLAEPQVDYAQSQLDALDAMVQNAQDQLDVLQGIDNSVLTVAEALSRFNDVVGNGQIITPESPVFTPDMPPQPAAPDNRAQEVNAELVAEVIELRNYMREIQRETKRTADAVNGRGDAPMLVETV